MPTSGKARMPTPTLLDPKVGDFVSETLVTDTVIWEVIHVTAKTIKVRKTRQGAVVKSENRDGNPWPVQWTEALSDPGGPTYTLRRRLDGSFRFGVNSGRFRPATMIDGKPASYTDYRM